MQPFRIAVADSVLDDLQARIARVRWSATASSDLRSLVHHWHTGYDWRRHESELNGMPQYTANIDGDTLHFVHARARTPNAQPLLLLHGWPDSFFHYHRVISELRDAFDVVVPSLPGVPFTGALQGTPSVQPTRHTGDMLHRLMIEVLRYRRYAIASDDHAGGTLAHVIAHDHPNAVIGIHLADHPHGDVHELVESTRPKTLAVQLADSPVGLASWISDHFKGTHASQDTILTTVMLNWVTNGAGPAVLSEYLDAESPSIGPNDRLEVSNRTPHTAALDTPDLYAVDVADYFHGAL